MEATQRDLEDEALANGAHRFHKRLKELAQDGDAAAEGAARKLLLNILEPTIAAVQAATEATDQRPWHILTKWVHIVGVEAAAFITIKTLLGRPHIDGNIARLAPTVAKLLHDEARYQKLRSEARGLFDFRMRRFNTSSYVHKSYALNQAARYAGVEDEVMSDREALMLGVKLINVCVSATNIGTFPVYTTK